MNQTEALKAMTAYETTPAKNLGRIAEIDGYWYLFDLLTNELVFY